MLACETSVWWCFQNSRRPWCQMSRYGFIQKGRISVLINEKKKTYNLDSKAGETKCRQWREKKGKHTLSRYNKAKGGEHGKHR